MYLLPSHASMRTNNSLAWFLPRLHYPTKINVSLNNWNYPPLDHYLQHKHTRKTMLVLKIFTCVTLDVLMFTSLEYVMWMKLVN